MLEKNEVFDSYIMVFHAVKVLWVKLYCQFGGHVYVFFPFCLIFYKYLHLTCRGISQRQDIIHVSELRIRMRMYMYVQQHFLKIVNINVAFLLR